MYVRLLTMNLDPTDRAVAESLADAAAKLYRASPGFRSGTWFVNEAATEYGSLSVWDSKEALDAASAKAQPLIKEKLGARLKNPPAVATFELYEPKI
jgi:heme-degrading monooxygenase HmoA